MPNLTKDDAQRIATKLGNPPLDPNKQCLQLEVRQKGPHDIVSIRYRNVLVGRFGIQRGSNRNARHNYIPEQIHLTRQQGAEFASCEMSIDQYIDIILRDEEIQSRLPKDKG
ncbi:MAG TPA: hypothetical protein VNH11_05765 [Pirellulales bacterium]|nr:hypothetical protein [Pirellulales bacterium]